jgi:capsular exopolysaccharide synthesis family protein
MDMKADSGATRGEHNGFIRFLPKGDVFDLQEMLRRFWRRKLLIAFCAAVLIVIGTAVIMLFTPVYTSKVLVMIGSENTDTIALSQTDDSQRGALVAELPDSSTIESQGQVMQSRNLAARVVEKLHLIDDPELNPALQKPTWIGAHMRTVMTYIRDLRAEILGKPPTPPATASVLDSVVDNLLANLEVSTVGKSRVLQVEYTSEDPDKAALIANTLASLYLVADAEARAKDRQHATDWLNERVADLRQKVSEAEHEVEDFRTASGLIATKDVDLATKDLSDISTQLIAAEAERASAEARLAQIESSIRSGNAESSSEVLSSALIQKLREQESDLRGSIAKLSQQYGEKHPIMLATKASIADLERKISIEVDRIADSVRGDVTVARAREEAIRRRVGELKEQVGHMNNARVRLDALEREATASRTLLENFLLRAQQLEGAVRQADAQIISPASPPDDPSFPNRKILFALVVMASVGFGIVVAIALEALESGFRSLEQVEESTGAPTLGFVPALKGMKSLVSSPEDYVLKKPGSAFTEAMRGIHTGLLMAGLESPPRRVLITSSVPGEGKSVTVVSLARILASAGDRVIVLDCDFRRARIHKMFGTPAGPGVMEILQGTASLEDVIVRDSKSPADLLPAGKSTPNPTGLLANDRMKDLLKTLGSRYDWVLLDSSPVLALSDARILARQVDQVLFLIRWAKTRRATVMAGLRQIVDTDAHIAGVVLTKVDVKRNAKYGYGDSGLYTGELRRYYVG